MPGPWLRPPVCPASAREQITQTKSTLPGTGCVLWGERQVRLGLARVKFRKWMRLTFRSVCKDA